MRHHRIEPHLQKKYYFLLHETGYGEMKERSAATRALAKALIKDFPWLHDKRNSVTTTPDGFIELEIYETRAEFLTYYERAVREAVESKDDLPIAAFSGDENNATYDVIIPEKPKRSERPAPP